MSEVVILVDTRTESIWPGLTTGTDKGPAYDRNVTRVNHSVRYALKKLRTLYPYATVKESDTTLAIGLTQYECGRITEYLVPMLLDAGFDDYDLTLDMWGYDTM